MKAKVLFFVATVSLSALAFAGQRNSANFKLGESVTIAGTQLAPGNYKLIWEGNAPNVVVSFVEGKKTLATAPAKLVSSASNEEAIETVTGTDNAPLLQAVDLNDVSIRFENAVPAAGN